MGLCQARAMALAEPLLSLPKLKLLRRWHLSSTIRTTCFKVRSWTGMMGLLGELLLGIPEVVAVDDHFSKY